MKPAARRARLICTASSARVIVRTRATCAERVFAGTYITEVEVREKALAWVPEVMRFASTTLEAGEAELDAADAESGVDGEIHTPHELAA